MIRLPLLLTIFVLSILAACTPSSEVTVNFSDLPESGDAERGAVLFADTETLSPTCISCHNIDQTASPTLADYSVAVAASRVEGQSAREYTFDSIVDPAKHIVEGYGNAMPNKYSEQLTPQDLADMITYLLSD